MIVYPELMKMLADKKISSYTCRKNGKIGQATWKVLNEGGHINTRTIDVLCEMLDCQPGDFLRWVPDETQQPDTSTPGENGTAG